MPIERLSMRQIKEVLRLKFAARLSQRQIARSLKLSTGVVAKYLAAAQRAGLTSWPLPEEMDEATLARRLWPDTTQPPAVVQRLATLDFADIHQQLKRKGVTRQLLWEEYAAAHPEGYGYTQFCGLCCKNCLRAIILLKFINLTLWESSP